MSSLRRYPLNKDLREEEESSLPILDGKKFQSESVANANYLHEVVMNMCSRKS